MRAIVEHVTALAQALEVAPPVIAGIVIKMCGGQDHSGLPLLYCLHEIRPTSVPAAAIAPTELRGVEPTAIGQAANPHAVRSTTSLTNTPGALEPDPSADLRLIAWIELARLRSDGHQYPRRRNAGALECNGRSHSRLRSQAAAQSIETPTVFCFLAKSRGWRAIESSVQHRPSGRSGGSRTRISVRPSKGVPR